MRAAQVLGIFAHPDDETLVAGGTLAACAAAGMQVRVLSVTHGESGPIADPSLATPETLGRVRAEELRSAAAALGLLAAECLDYPDGGLDWLDPAPLQRDLKDAIRHGGADVVVTFGPEGLYYHPDHVVLHRVVSAAGAELDAEGLKPQLYFATWPSGAIPALATAARALGSPAELWGVKPESFGADPASITTTVDVRRFVPVKLAALDCYRTQLGPDHLFRVLPPAALADFLAREYFARPEGDAREPILSFGIGEYR